jgi:hypothetical protein
LKTFAGQFDSQMLQMRLTLLETKHETL